MGGSQVPQPEGVSQTAPSSSAPAALLPLPPPPWVSWLAATAQDFDPLALWLMSLLPRWALILEAWRTMLRVRQERLWWGSSGSLWAGGPLEDGFSNSGLEQEVAGGGGVTSELS